MATMKLHILRHREAQSPQTTQTHKSTGSALSHAHPPGYSSISVLSDSYIPSPPNSDSEYMSYSVHNLNFHNITLHADRNSPALYTIINSTFTRRIPSVVLHAGPRTTPAIGAAYIARFKGIHRFGVRRAGSSSPEITEGMSWEELHRTSTWTHATYTFEWACADGERRKYEWRRTSGPLLFDDQNDLELVEMGRDRIVLAKYRRGAYFRWTVRARLDIKVVDEKGQEQWERWKTVVLLTAMTLVEMTRRRSRRRKKM